MLNELSNDPIQAAIARLERQHEEDKQGNLIYYSINNKTNLFVCFSILLSNSRARKTTPRI